MCNDEQYRCANGDFRLYDAWLSHCPVENVTITLCRLQDIQYLLRIFYIAHAQQMRYVEAMSDVMNYATIALSAIDYVETNVNANKCIGYSQLYEELKALW
jgi:hypothetical protein